VIHPFLQNKLCCFILVAVHVSVPSVKVSDTLIAQTHLYTIVKVLAVLSLVAVTLFANSLALAVDKAIQVAVVVAGALIKVARFALVVSTSTPISTEPAHEGVALKVNVTHSKVIVSHSVGLVAKPNTAEPAV
jgi:hypothetical protein